MRVLLTSALLALLAVALGEAAHNQGREGGQQPPQQPTFRTGTNLVQVDALVSDQSGNPVSDLTAADFDVTDDGAPVPITAFRFVSARVASEWRSDVIAPIRNVDDEAREAAIEGVRVFAIFLDEYHVGRFNAIRAVPALVAFVRALPPSDLLAVYGVMDSVRDERFTRDREPALRKIQAFEGRMGVYTPPKYPAEEEHLRYARDIERLRMQVSTSAIEAIVAHAGAVSERRKSIIIVTEAVGLGNRSRSALDQIADDADYIGTMVGAANRVNASLYPLDPGGLRIGPSSSMLDKLRGIADQTGGRAIVNQNDLGKALAQVNRDASAYYLLGFVSSHPSDGKFHKIAIRVKRRGVAVRAREGYLAPKAEDIRTESAAPVVPPEVTKAFAAMADALRPAGNELILPKRAFETAAAAATAAKPAARPAALLDTPTLVVLRTGQPEQRAARPEFERSQRIAVRAVTAAGDGVAPQTVTASLLGRTGQELTKIPVTIANGRAEIVLTLATLGAGDYVVRLVAERGAERIEQYVALRVLR